jgi:tol-pal system-associated acyl-CoA thioesterase
MNEFIYPLRVHIEDTDYAGVVYHSNYLNFMERARSEWADHVGIGLPWQKQHGLLFPVHRVNIIFMKPARLHEKIEVVSSIVALKPASMIFEQYLRLAEDKDKILCKAEIKIACTDEEMKPRTLPDAPFFETIRRVIS